MITECSYNLVLEFGNNVKTYRLKQNITQAQLAFEANMPREQIVRIEKGQVNISLKKVEAIAKALNIHPKELFVFEME
jgi:transcriptional regulator with XRE-family HTH domain